MNTTSKIDRPTRWDLSNIYSGLDAEDYKTEFSGLVADLKDLAAHFDAHRIDRLSTPPQVDDALAELTEDLLRRVGSVELRRETLESYVYGHITTDSFSNAAAREMSKVDALSADWKKLSVRLTSWIGSLQGVLDELIARSEYLAECRFFLTDAARQSEYQMSAELEALAAELCLDAGIAFGKLQGNITSQLKVAWKSDEGNDAGSVESLSITTVQNFAYDPDETIRRRGYQAEIEAWRSAETTVAACLNGVKGTAATLARRRGRESLLDEALDQNKVDRQTLDAMMDSIRESFPLFRRYLRSKAGKLGKKQLAWWDIFAPMGAAESSLSWQQARDLLVEKFGSFDSEMAELAEKAFDQNWIDGEPRVGKRAGGFCMPIPKTEESRILVNFDGSYEQTGTLAHELGHAFHNHCQRGLDPLLRGSPMTLAETASIFCETLVAEAALQDASPAEQLMILESQLSGATQVCLDISSRFAFETAVFAARNESELSAEQFRELMRTAQEATYADAVDPETYHPYMWLWKPHYYAMDSNFYNFPYAFGHLFSLGLYAIYRSEGEPFIPRYKTLLRETGQDDAAPLAGRFDIDIRTQDFWRQSLAIIEDQVDRYEELSV